MQRALLVSGAALCLLTVAALAQRGRYRVYNSDNEPAIAVREAEFHHRGFGFASRDGQGSGWWIIDWPTPTIISLAGFSA